MTRGHSKHDVVNELRAAGLFPTVQRRLVLHALEGRDRPVTALELHECLRGDGPSVGLTTVYRTLHALADTGLVHVFRRHGELAYRHCHDGPHHHLVCEVCGLVAERPTRTVTRWMQQVRTEEDFVPNPDHSDLYGVCGACLRAAHRQRRPVGSHQEHTSSPGTLGRADTTGLRATVRNALGLDDNHTVVIQQLACAEPDCPPAETFVAVLSATDPPLRWTIHKPMADVTGDDIRASLTRQRPEGAPQ